MTDVAVVGAGPNGLAAAVTLARAGLEVTVFEAKATIGGGARTAELTLPGFLHDICSAVHPMAFASAFFRRFDLAARVPFALPDVSYAHPLDDGRAGVAYRDLDRTAAELGVDGAAWKRLMGPLSAHPDDLADFAGSQLLRVPRHPLVATAFGLRALEQGSPLWNVRFSDDIAPAMLSGVAAHSILPMPSLGTAGAALSLGAYAHGRGWPIPLGGTQSIVEALADDLRAHGGRIETGREITDVRELPAARVMFDTSPRAMVRIAGRDVPARYARAVSRFRYGNAAAKVDFALSGPVPWRDARLRDAGTLHLGGPREAVAAAERAVAEGRHPENPYVLVAQPSIADPSRAPEGKQSLWTYTHVPRGSDRDMTEAIIAQIERFAPGFRDLVLASSSRTAVQMEQYNANYIGGDIAAGAATLAQLVKRPIVSTEPWRTPMPGVYLGSSSTPPGPGVHGLAGWHAARSMLRHEFGVRDEVDLSPAR
jgi:phytoene dehydrogenase-like protein